MKRLIFVVLICLLWVVPAQARIYIPVDQTSEQKFPIAIPDMKGSYGEEIASIIRNDLTICGYFRVLNPAAFNTVSEREGITAESIRFDYWAAIEAQALVKGEVKNDGGKITIEARLFDPVSREMLVGKSYKAGKDQLRKMAHRFSDEIMEALTGVRGVFNTRIAYVAQTSKKSKDIYVMDMDGEGSFAVTSNKSINVSPAWSPDGSQLVFTSYMRGQIDLFTVKVGDKNYKRLTPGNFESYLTPAWSYSGKLIAYSSTNPGAANLYTISPGGKSARRLTTNYNIDISPTWSPGDDAIIFASERAGGLHLFRTGAGGGGAERLTFVGYQNDMPDWSPMGDKVAFAGRDMGTFDIFIMNPDGSNIQRLTIDAGSNENPTFSPDGRLIAFSSTRSKGMTIYIMRSDGSNQTQIGKGGLLPDWSPRVE